MLVAGGGRYGGTFQNKPEIILQAIAQRRIG